MSKDTPQVNKAEEYIPYGPEWEKELMKHSKKSLIDLYRSLIIDISSPPDAGKEQDAVDDKFEFAEWCENNYWGDGKGLWKKSIAEDEAEEFTTQQLYTLYNQNKHP